MKTADFDYHLPEDLIALYPSRKRDHSRLMVVRRYNKTILHLRFYDLPEVLKERDLLVLNDTKVLPVRLLGRIAGGRDFEVLLTEKINAYLWKTLARNPKEGMIVEFERGLKGRLLRDGRDQWLLEFGHISGDDGLSPTTSMDEKEEDFGTIDHYVKHFGNMPLPHYIKRRPEDRDRTSYQTVYAEKEGAIAAPTAGLHFSDELLDRIRSRGIEIRKVTLHVGMGTFKPVKTEDLREHVIHHEYREVPVDTAISVRKAKAERRRIIAVGTTVVRSLESSVDRTGAIRADSGYTDLYIYPGFRFQIIDALITNFHLPRSTLLMLVSAFAGRDLILRAYEEAKRRGYRFLSYGDAMLII